MARFNPGDRVLIDAEHPATGEPVRFRAIVTAGRLTAKPNGQFLNVFCTVGIKEAPRKNVRHATR